MRAVCNPIGVFRAACEVVLSRFFKELSQAGKVILAPDNEFIIKWIMCRQDYCGLNIQVVEAGLQFQRRSAVAMLRCALS